MFRGILTANASRNGGARLLTFAILSKVSADFCCCWMLPGKLVLLHTEPCDCCDCGCCGDEVIIDVPTMSTKYMR